MGHHEKSGYGIIGLGRFGIALANLLSEAGEDVLVIDKNEMKLRRIRDSVQEAFLLNKLTEESLEETGIGECATVIIGISKVDVSVLTAHLVLEMGVPRVITKAASKQHGIILKKIGSEVVYPEAETATRWAGLLLGSKATDLMRLNGDYVISEMRIPQGNRGTCIKDMNLEKHHVRLVGVETEPDETILEVSPEYILHGGDQIIVSGKFKDVESFEINVVDRL